MLQPNETNEINAMSVCAQHWCISIYFLFKVHCKATSTLLLAYLTSHCYQISVYADSVINSIVRAAVQSIPRCKMLSNIACCN